MQQHGSKYFARRSYSPREPGGGGQNTTHSEFGQVAYQIEGNEACSNRVANTLPEDPTLTLGSKYNFFSEHGHVLYQIKWNRECKHPWVGVKTFFLRLVM